MRRSTSSAARRAGVAVALTALMSEAFGVPSMVRADPVSDALTTLNSLSRKAEQTSEAMYSASLVLQQRQSEQAAAEQAHAADLAALDAAREKLQGYRTSVNRYMVAEYMGGNGSLATALLTAPSPGALIDRLSMNHLVGISAKDAMANYKHAVQTTGDAEKKSAESENAARAATEQAQAVSAELRQQQNTLRVQIAAARSQFNRLTAEQRAALAPPAPAPESAPTPEGDPLAAPLAPPEDALFDINRLLGLAQPVAPEMLPPAVMRPPGAGRSDVVQAALSQVGSSYSWGGQPGAERSAAHYARGRRTRGERRLGHLGASAPGGHLGELGVLAPGLRGGGLVGAAHRKSVSAHPAPLQRAGSVGRGAPGAPQPAPARCGSRADRGHGGRQRLG